jgi:hypothetical protein
VESIKERYAHLLRNLLGKAYRHGAVTDDNVYQRGQEELLPHIDSIVAEQLLPGSGVAGFDSLETLLGLAESGESCLLLMEHYSNFDLPAFHYLLRKAGESGARVAKAVVAIAGIKLSETNPLVSAFTNAYSRIVIYPSRSLEIIKQNLKDPNRLVAEMMRSSSINRAAMKALGEAKRTGKLVLVFPAGTRFRPWDPASKRGVREIASYLKSFSKFCLVAVNGNILRLNPSGEMSEDILHKDRLVFTASPVIDGAEFVDRMKRDHHFREDKKQAMVDHIMSELDRMHEEVEKSRLID